MEFPVTIWTGEYPTSRLSISQERSGFHDPGLADEGSQTGCGTWLVAVDRATPPIPDEYKDSSMRPYAIIDFDKLQVRVDSNSGTSKNPIWTGFPRVFIKFPASSSAELRIHLYIPVDEDGHSVSLGYARLQAEFKGENEDRQLAVHSLNLHTGGTIHVGVQYSSLKIEPGGEPGGRRFCFSRPSSPYHLVHVGIHASEEKGTNRVYAIKKIRKKDASHESAWYAQIARAIDHPFIAPLAVCAEPPGEIYLLSPLICGGHLFYYLQMEGHFELHRSKHYAAEILSALEYLHGLDMALDDYGRLQPSNIRLDTIGHVAICDFGLYTGKQEVLTKEEEIQWTEYPSPELLLDWWITGSILYEMLLGLPPFASKDRETMCSRILSDLLEKLLCRPDQRLGTNGAWEIKTHPFFHNIDWDRLAQREYTPTFKPSETGPTMEFTSKKTERSKQTIRSQFADWGITEEQPQLMTRSQNPETALFEANLTQRLEEAQSQGATDRIEVLRTQLLSLAVDRHEVAKVRHLLASGVSPNFPASLHPTAHHPIRSSDWSQELISASARDQYIPPLARAVGWGDVELARLLLEAGADANTGFHCYSDPTAMGFGSRFGDCCGRVVQLAMKLEDEAMVELLWEFGADGGMAWPVIKNHHCKAFDRRSWVRMRERWHGRQRWTT